MDCELKRRVKNGPGTFTQKTPTCGALRDLVAFVQF